ncbi:polygalacturonase QRT3-like [Corylus avellana]|uniref:polygalacturonase QRT3-like n=1 Tax=Corylus avellana TaxID=13451 RepID=UPI001E23E9B2|nr:polygalacturonase QRT3-like [Corylus avellana]
MKKSILALSILVLLLVEEATGHSIEKKLSEFREKLASSPTGSSLPTPLTSDKKKDGRVLYPIGYGADPTGEKDSSDAILQALGDAFQLRTGLELLSGIRDFGGVEIDLQGGSYKISRPIRFPSSGGGNILVQGGTLRASDTFPGDRHLIELWSTDSPTSYQNYQNAGYHYEDITFRDILFDSTYRGGGIFIVDSARIRINNCFFLHFTTQGILVQRGHETFISSCFLGQHSTVGGSQDEKNFAGTAIDLASNDNAVTDVAIFSAAIGIVLRGQANMLTGVHCYNKATFFGGIGILLKLAGCSQTRIDNCYLDYTAIVMEDPVQVHVTNGFFLGNANVVLKSVNGQISGLNIVDNMFSGQAENMVPIIKLDGKFTDIDQVVIDRYKIQ